MICPECSEEIKENIRFCPYCGVKMQLQETKDEKDLKIKELEEKVTKLENTSKINNKSYNLQGPYTTNPYYNQRKRQDLIESKDRIKRVIIGLCLISFLLIIILIVTMTSYYNNYYP